MSPHSQMSAVRFASSVYRNKCKPFRLAWLCGQRPPLHEEQSFGLYGDRPHSCRKWALRLNRASLRREPETAGRYSFNHPKVGSDSFVRCMAQVFRQSRRDSVPGHSESVATEDQKADGKFDPPIERSCLTNNFCNKKNHRTLRAPVPFCHLRLFFSRNGKSRKTISPGSSP
jgi:hypothetical protein